MGHKIEVHAMQTDVNNYLHGELDWYIENGRVEESEDGEKISIYDDGELVGVISKKDILSMHSCKNDEEVKPEA
ncbi:MAG: hypothetical protein IT365_11830 [Candidatus Hydrogenedentes bacterium]|nr:hypothetical protein [Candidatus Hydrogenedentota bacterium]